MSSNQVRAVTRLVSWYRQPRLLDKEPSQVWLPSLLSSKPSCDLYPHQGLIKSHREKDPPFFISRAAPLARANLLNWVFGKEAWAARLKLAHVLTNSTVGAPSTSFRRQICPLSPVGHLARSLVSQEADKNTCTKKASEESAFASDENENVAFGCKFVRTNGSSADIP